MSLCYQMSGVVKGHPAGELKDDPPDTSTDLPVAGRRSRPSRSRRHGAVGRLAGYEGVNNAGHLSRDRGMHAVVDRTEDNALR
jgi:hypothetical protein